MHLVLAKWEKCDAHIFMLRQNANSNSMTRFKKKSWLDSFAMVQGLKYMEKSWGVFESNLNKYIVYIYFKEEKKNRLRN